MGKRAERDKARVKQQVGPWLYRFMVPGERIVTGVRAVAGPPPAGLLAVGLAFGLADIAYWINLLVHGMGSPIPPGLVTPVLLGLNYLNRPVFLAVTDRQVICFRLSAYGGKPARFLFAAPLPDVRITRYRRGRWRASLHCRAPVDGRSRNHRLSVPRVWQPDLDALLPALTGQPAPLTAR